MSLLSGGTRFWSGAWALLLAGVAPGCARQGVPVAFQGHARDQVVPSHEVLELSALPRSARRLGRLDAHCRNTLSWSAFDARSLLELDCNTARLRRLLREAASQHGGDTLAAVQCSGGARPHCTAVLGLTSARGALAQAAAASVSDDVRGGLGSEVYLGFAPKVLSPGRPRRSPDSVSEIPFLPPSHVVAGSVSAHCAECEALPLRDALRIVGGELGVSDLVGVSCVPWQQGHRCTALAAMPEVEPDPSALRSVSALR